MSEHLTPLEVTKLLIGPLRTAVAEAAEVTVTAPYHWAHPSKDRDAGDIPSARIMRRLLRRSAAQGLGLTADHLILGASRAEVDAILAARAPRVEAAE